MLSEHVAYLWMIRLVDVELNGVSGDRLFFHLDKFSLSGVREMFVDCFNVFNIDVALLVAVSYTHLTLPTILLV